jgi:hypothetical protein
MRPSSTDQQQAQTKVGKTMKHNFWQLSAKAGKMDVQHVRLAMAVGALVLFVLGAGAPAGRGDF